MRILCPSPSDALPSAFRGSGHRNSLPKQPHLMPWRTLAGGGKRGREESGGFFHMAAFRHKTPRTLRPLHLILAFQVNRKVYASGQYIF